MDGGAWLGRAWTQRLRRDAGASSVIVTYDNPDTPPDLYVPGDMAGFAVMAVAAKIVTRKLT